MMSDWSSLFFVFVFGGIFAADFGLFTVTDDDDLAADPDARDPTAPGFVAGSYFGEVLDPESADPLAAETAANDLAFFLNGDVAPAEGFAADHAHAPAQSPDPDQISGPTEADPAGALMADDSADAAHDGPDDANLFLAADDGAPDSADDSFTVYQLDTPDSPAAQIDDFDPSRDSLHIHYAQATDPETGAPVPPLVEVQYDSDADQTAITLDGHRIAALAGDPGLAASELILTPIA